MSDCPRLAMTTCSQTGQGFTRAPLNPGDTEVQLMTGHGDQFPELTPGHFFFISVYAGCSQCCETMRVTARTGDILTVERPAAGACGCMKSNATVVYARDSREHLEALIRDIGINVVPPLRFDPCTRTLSINCEELHEMVSRPCGGGNAPP